MGKKTKGGGANRSSLKHERNKKTETTKPRPDTADRGGSANRPRNHLITDATKPFDFSFHRFGKKHTITVKQTAAEETWPGGALWDLGVLLAHVLVSGWTRGATSQHISNKCPPTLQRNVVWNSTVVLELGCGVGLTGLVAAALGAQLTVLTDLDVIVEGVTKPNVERNSQPGPNKTCGYRIMMPGGGKVAAVPLCWGNEEDEAATTKLLDALAPSTKPSSRNKHSSHQPTSRFPDLIIVGDVAYQHKPGAPSHFDALVSTLMSFVGDNTTVLFGTRMRMPASNDLLLLFREHLEEEVMVEAHEIDPSLLELKHKHNMTVHVFCRKR